MACVGALYGAGGKPGHPPTPQIPVDAFPKLFHSLQEEERGGLLSQPKFAGVFLGAAEQLILAANPTGEHRMQKSTLSKVPYAEYDYSSLWDRCHID